MYDTEGSTLIGELVPGGWVANQYETAERLYRTHGGDYFLHKMIKDKRSGNTTDEIEPIAMENAHELMDHHGFQDITDAEKDKIKQEDQRNELKRKM